MDNSGHVTGTMKNLINTLKFTFPKHPKWQRVVNWGATSFAIVGIVLILAWTALHLFIVPRIAGYRAELEQQTSRAMKLEAHIGGLQVQGGWWVPVLQATDIALIDKEGRQVLQLPSVRAALSLRSVLFGQLESLELIGLEIDARRTADGHIWVAGVDTSIGGGGGGADWFFSLPKFVMREGALNWNDETAAQQKPLTLNGIGVTLQNSWFHHDLQLAISPPSVLGEPLQLKGGFRQWPWQRAGNMKQWAGELTAAMPHINLKRLSEWLPINAGFALEDAEGSMQLKAVYEPGHLTSVTADLNFEKFDARMGKGLHTLALRNIRGRVGAALLGEQLEFSSHDLVFDTLEKEHWPGGEIKLSSHDKTFETGAFKADRIDLQAVAKIAQRLALPETARQLLTKAQPSGQLNQFKGDWALVKSGVSNESSKLNYSASGTLQNLSWEHDDTVGSPLGKFPGVKGISLSFDVTQEGGSAKLDMQAGHLFLPNNFEEQHLEVKQAQVDLSWQINDKNLAVQIKKSHIATPDITIDLDMDWKTAEGDSRFPGVLSLNASVDQLKVNRVHRFLPTTLSPGLRKYIVGSFQGGDLNKVQIRLRGNLRDMPFADPALGEFLVTAKLARVQFAYVPPPVPALPDQLPWPALTEMNGELVLDRQSLKITGATQLVGAPHVLWRDVNIQIPSFAAPVVLVHGQAAGPMQEILDMVSNSALNKLTGGALKTSRANGNGRYRLDITVPLKELKETKVEGRIDFENNSLQLSHTAPKVTDIRGAVGFAGPALKVTHLHANLLGGQLHANGELSFAKKTVEAKQAVDTKKLLIKGSITSEGLRQAAEMGGISNLSQHMTGGADYSASIEFKQGHLALLATTDLKAMGLNLPAPFTKAAGVSMPIRAEIKPTASQDDIRVSVGNIFGLHYVRDVTGEVPKVLRGAIAMGDALREPVQAKSPGVTLNFRMAELDLDAWQEAFKNTSSPTATKPETVKPLPVAASKPATDMTPYLPSKISWRVGLLTTSHREFHGLGFTGSRQGDLIHLKMDGQEVAGTVDVRLPHAQEALQINARLAYLHVPAKLEKQNKTEQAEVSKQADKQEEDKTDVNSLPNLNLLIEDLRLNGLKLGRLDVDAANKKAGLTSNLDWQLNHFKLNSPDISLTLDGSWKRSLVAKSGTSSTHLNLAIEAKDLGRLLDNFKLKGLMSEGDTQIKGELNWVGSPAKFDASHLNGKLNLNIEKGMVVKIEPGAGRLVGVLNIESLPRRLRLDFSDLFSDGLAFDQIQADLSIDKGVVRTSNFTLEGVIATAQMEGQADLANQTQDLKVTITPHINTGTSSVYLATINPLLGLTNFVTQYLLTTPINKVATTQLRIDGTWSKPQVTKVN